MRTGHIAGLAVAGVLLVPGLAMSQGTASLSGRVLTSAGTPPAGAIVTAYREFENGFMRPLGLVEADANGSFELRGLPDARVILNFQAPCFATAQQELDLRVGANGPVNATLLRTGTVSGDVHDPEFRPIAGAVIALLPVPGSGVLRPPAFNLLCGGGRPTTLATDENGRYEARDVSPGPYFVAVMSRAGRVLYPDSHTIETAVAIVVEEAGAVRDINIAWSPPAQAITGRVVDRRGRALRNLVIEYGQEGGTHRGSRTITTADGAFVIFDPLLPRGAVTLIARGETDDGPAVGLVHLTVDGGHTGITIYVNGLGRVTGRVLLQGASVLPDRIALRLVPVGFVARSAATATVSVSPGDEFTLDGLSGEYQVQLASDAWVIAEVRRDGRAVPGGRFEVMPEGAVELEVTVSPRK